MIILFHLSQIRQIQPTQIIMSSTEETTGSVNYPAQFLNVGLSFVTVVLCGANLLQYEELLIIGKLTSITLYLLVASEVARWFMNKYSVGLEPKVKKGFQFTATSRAAPKVSPVIQNITEVIKVSGLLSGFTLLYAVVCILMGAPSQSNYEGTLVLSALLTALTILPVCLYLGFTWAFRCLYNDFVELTMRAEAAHLEFLHYNAIGTLIGAWSGSVVVPLDWDREWQVYPIPNIVGALVGFAAANIYTLANSLYSYSRQVIRKNKLL